MAYLNFSNLDSETQQYLMEMSKKDVKESQGRELKRYAKRNGCKYETLLEQACPEQGRREAQRNLHSYDYIFNI